MAAGPVISQLRVIKEDAEIEHMRDAAHVADTGMTAANTVIRAGIREIDVAGGVEYAMRFAGAEGWAPVTYVASGLCSAIAHGAPTLKTLAEGDVVQVHVAPIASGYTVDLCRTFFIGRPAVEAARALEAYVEAQEAGIAAATAKAPLHRIDVAMSVTLNRKGYADAFLRLVFHEVGMEHEKAPIPGGHAVIHG